MPARRRRCLVALLLALPAALLCAAPASAFALAPEAPHSPNAKDIETSYWVMLAVAAGLIVAINVALIGAAVRFRSQRGRRPARLAAGRGALRPVIGGLTVLALAVFVFGVVMTGQVREIEPSGPGGLEADQTAQVGIKTVASETPPLEISAIAQQWLWRFEYPGHSPSQSIFSYGELVVPVDTAVILNVDSTDVMHSWWVPALGGQVQATPGSVAQTWFKADAVGRYPGRSTVFSGTAFPAMRAWVRVVEVPEYEAYVEQLRSDLAEAQGAVAERRSAGVMTTTTTSRPEIVTRDVHGTAHAVGRADDQRGPQVRRAPVPGDGALVLLPGGGRVRAHAPPADRPGEHDHLAGDLQSPAVGDRRSPPSRWSRSRWRWD